MIIWLASFPRSGNTLLRVILNEVFGLKSYSKYDDTKDIGADAGMRAAVGHEFLPGPWPEASRRFAASDEAYFVKTHEGPEDTGKAIYVAREGFAAVRSYQKYLRDFAQTECSLREMILGAKGFTSWGRHLDLWQPCTRPETLLIKFEDLVESPEPQLERIAEFCALKPRGSWTNHFDRLRSLNPRFFRQGQTRHAAAEFPEECQQLLWALHGDWMVRLGYGGPKSVFPLGQAILREYLAGLMTDHQRLAEQREREVTQAALTFETLEKELEARRRDLKKAEDHFAALDNHHWTRWGKKLKQLPSDARRLAAGIQASKQ